MVITFSSLLLKNSAGKWNTLVNFGSASTRLTGQFSVGANSLAFSRVLVRNPRLLILDEATSALDSANEAALYQRVRASGASVISIAHRPAVLKHHTHVLELRGDGAWALHAASDFVFDR